MLSYSPPSTPTPLIFSTFYRARGKARATAKADVNLRNRQERAALEKARATAKEVVVRADSSTNMKKRMSTKKVMEEEGRREQKAQTIIRIWAVEICVAREMSIRIEWLPSEKRKIPVCKVSRR